MCEGGFIVLQRKILEWEWIDDPNTLVTWIHILLSANWQDNKWHGIVIPRGAALLSYNKLAMQTGLSVQNVRTAIDHLKSTGEITCQSTRYGLLINVVNYAKYQDKQAKGNTQTNTVPNRESTENQQAGNREVTTLEQEEQSNNKNNKRGAFKKPTLEEVKSYISEKGYFVDPERFINYYESNGWRVGRNKMADWKATVRSWASKDQKPVKDMPAYISNPACTEKVTTADLEAVRQMQKGMNG